MGAELPIFRLYRWFGDAQGTLLLVKAIRRQFPNWDQTAEDDADLGVDATFNEILGREAARRGSVWPELIGSWEDGCPEGDVFYGSESGIEIDIWIAFDVDHPGYFLFGTQMDEWAFWHSINELVHDGEICNSTYSRPARRARVMFVQ